jgi:hypothetical protein
MWARQTSRDQRAYRVLDATAAPVDSGTWAASSHRPSVENTMHSKHNAAADDLRAFFDTTTYAHADNLVLEPLAPAMPGSD